LIFYNSWCIFVDKQINIYGIKMSLTHQQLDKRSLSFDRIIVYLIDHDSNRRGLIAARENLSRWMKKSPDSIPQKMWSNILKKPWKEVKKYLLSQSDEMQFLRQSSPFAGSECIPNDIRMRIIKKYYDRASNEKNRSRTCR
jgi:hypothetical protein